MYFQNLWFCRVKTMCLLLVVDDDDALREAMAAILAALGHDVLHARDGLEALHIHKAKHDQIHLILMDIKMPKMDGIAATKVIKETYPSAKIILMSGNPEHVPVEADAFLSKPFRSKDLFQIVHQTLEAVL